MKACVADAGSKPAFKPFTVEITLDTAMEAKGFAKALTHLLTGHPGGHGMNLLDYVALKRIRDEVQDRGDHPDC